MSENVYESETLYLTELIGPASEGKDRRRWQITCPVESYATLNSRQLVVFLIVAMSSLIRRGGVK